MTIKKKDGNFIGHKTKLSVGLKAPDFEEKDQHGDTIRLSDFSGKMLILYFYPKDDTPTCTKQACNLRDEHLILKEKGYAVVGVSADDVKSHIKFSKKFSLPFSLLADTNLNMIKAYDVWGTKMLFGKIYDGIVRSTFLIDQKGIIKKIITNVESAKHAQQILSL